MKHERCFTLSELQYNESLQWALSKTFDEANFSSPTFLEEFQILFIHLISLNFHISITLRSLKIIRQWTLWKIFMGKYRITQWEERRNLPLSPNEATTEYMTSGKIVDTFVPVFWQHSSAIAYIFSKIFWYFWSTKEALFPIKGK